LTKKKPWEYYEDGKFLLGQNRLMEAKASFLCYRNYVMDQKAVVGDDGIREPSKDNHLHYLAQIQDKLNQTPKEAPTDITFSVGPVKNQYWGLWEQWKKNIWKPANKNNGSPRLSYHLPSILLLLFFNLR